MTTFQEITSLQIAQKKDAKRMAQFMVTMAKQTQDLILDSDRVTQAVQYLIESSFGQTIAKKVQGQSVAALFLSYQNSQIWWISSVFVSKQYRGKGLFSQLFNFAIDLARSQGVKKIRLYAQNSNMKAKNTYQHMGMKIIPDKFFGYDLTIGCQPLQFPFRSTLKVQRVNDIPSLNEFKDICKRETGINKSLACFENDEIIGYCEYFLEFSEWRFGLTAIISTLFIKNNQELKSSREILNSFFNYLKQIKVLKVKALRVMSKNQDDLIAKLSPGIQKLHYDILEINIDPSTMKNSRL